MQEPRADLIAWTASEIMPHEPAVRRWIARSGAPPDQVDDLIQEAYCKLASLASVDHITNPGAYFYQIVRSLQAEAKRRARIVRFDSITEIDAPPVICDEPSPERTVAARRELDQVLALISKLPDRCKIIFELRKINGLSQKEISARLGVSENVVENDIARGMRIISKAMRDKADDC